MNILSGRTSRYSSRLAIWIFEKARIHSRILSSSRRCGMVGHLFWNVAMSWASIVWAVEYMRAERKTGSVLRNENCISLIFSIISGIANHICVLESLLSSSSFSSWYFLGYCIGIFPIKIRVVSNSTPLSRDRHMKCFSVENSNTLTSHWRIRYWVFVNSVSVTAPSSSLQWNTRSRSHPHEWRMYMIYSRYVSEPIPPIDSRRRQYSTIHHSPLYESIQYSRVHFSKMRIRISDEPIDI